MSTTGYSEDSQGESEGSQEPLMIEATTSEPDRTQAPSSAVDGLTITEAAAAYGISVSTLRRRLKAGEIVGAAKVTGPKGQEYRVPPEALEALGYTALESRAGVTVKAAKATLEAEQLLIEVKELRARDELRSVKLAMVEQERDLLSASLDDLRSALSSMQLAIGAAPKKRWWSR